MRRTITGIAAVALVVALGACGDDDDGSDGSADPPRCAEAFAEGVDVSIALRAADEGCIDDEGDLSVVGTASEECPDGRTLHWNDEGWGYDDDIWHRHERADGQLVPPDEDLEACS